MRAVLAVVAAVAAAVWFATASAGQGKPSQWDADAAQRKADYTFFQALSALESDTADVAMRLADYAHVLSPYDREIASQRAFMELLLTQPDSARIVRDYETMLDRWRHNRTDYNSGDIIAALAKSLSRIDDMVEIYSATDSLYPSKTDPAVNLANAYLLKYVQNTADTAAFNRALGIFNRIEQGTGKDLGLSSQKIRAYSLRADTAAIEAEIADVMSELGNDATANLYAGSIYESLGRDSLSLVYYYRACSLDSSDGRGYMRLANYYRERQDSTAFDREVFNALRSQNLEFDDKYEILRSYVSELYSDSTQWPRIEELFGVLGRVNPGEAGVHKLFGAFKWEQRDTVGAREQFGYAAALDNTDDQTHMQLVQMDAFANNMKAVVSDASRAKALFPDNFYFPIMEATGRYEQNLADSAISVLRRVDISNVTNPKAVSNLLTTLGDMYYKAEKPDSAFAVYERAIKLNPDNVMAMNNAGYFLAEQDRELDKAEKYARYAVLSDPHNPTYLDTYAWVYFKKRDYNQARKYIDQALEAHGIFSADSVTEADSVATEAVEPVLPDSLATTGPDGLTPDQEVEAVEEAAGIVDEAVYEEPSAEVLTHAGDIYFMSGSPDRAVEFWEMALEKDPDNDLLKRKVKQRTFFYK